MVCVDIIMGNTYLSETRFSMPVQPNDGWKKGVSCKLPAGIICTGVTRTNNAIVDNVPDWAVTRGDFTINALQVGSCDVAFQFSDGKTETISVTVFDPAQPGNTEVTFNVPKSATKVILVIER